MPDRPLAEVLVAVPVEERTLLEQQLSRASIAVWRARRALGAPHLPEASLTAWRAYLHKAEDALAAADAVVAPRAEERSHT